MLRLSIIVPAFNEQEAIGAKLADLCNTDLETDRFEVLVGSDGSTDGTAATVRAFSAGSICIKLYEYENEGKAATLTKLINESSGDIILGSDADCLFGNPSLLRHLLERFESEPRLGGISCVPVFDTNAVEQGYWKAEHRVRQFLSDRGKLFVVTGMGFAFRKSAHDPVPADIMADDLWLPLSILKNGYSIVSDDRFQSKTDIFPDERELVRKIRVVRGGIQCLLRFFSTNPRMLFTPVFMWVLLFKVSKWSLPFTVLACFGVLCLIQWQLALLLLAVLAVGIVFNPSIRYLAFGIALPLAAVWQVLFGRYEARWGHVR